MPRVLLLASALLLTLALPAPAAGELLQRPALRDFIAAMAAKHDYDAGRLRQVFGKVRLSAEIIAAISKPAEALPWHQYRPIFLGPQRVSQGVRFWRENRATLERATAAYGVPMEIIVAVIGVETRYGRNKGGYKVIDALSTLAFDYPKRSRFFTAELEQYLLLTREQGLDPHALKGSYAGAMGIPQFISSSYRNYAVDFDEDGKIDIWNNTADAIGSVANYLAEHGWRAGAQIAIAAAATESEAAPFLDGGLKPDLPLAALIGNGIHPLPSTAGENAAAGEPRKPPEAAGKPPSADSKPPANRPPRKTGLQTPVKLLQYKTRDGYEYWFGLQNFYAITRYNRSQLYALAVYQLAEAIRRRDAAPE